MKNILFRIVVTALAATLAGCASPLLQREQTSSLMKGLTVVEAEQMFKPAKPEVEHAFDANGRNFIARHYSLQTGSRSEMTVICTPACMPMAINIPVSDPYALVFESGTGQLYAWGTLEELSKHPEDSISSIMPTLKASYDLALAEKQDKSRRRRK